ncbi:MAG: hypothetical protein SGJ09_16565 [Phycisphaerae bacterium]|nr:hypothetical protein [Phycisphaerae bacterium]
MSRSVWWPRFHDSAFAPALRDQFALHWQANLLMLRSTRAVFGFFAITLVPIGILTVGWWAMDRVAGKQSWFLDGWWGPVTALTMLVTFAVFQHLAFVQAMNRTYGPFVRQAMRQRGIPVCPRCGHLLPPHSAPQHCGECGGAV